MSNDKITEIHRLDSSNVDQLKMLTFHPVPDEWLGRFELPVEEGVFGTIRLRRDDVVEDGNPTDWVVLNRNGFYEWRLDWTIPCSFDWCEGHDDAYYPWDRLVHQSKYRKRNVHWAEGEACIVASKGKEPELHLIVNIETKFWLDEIDVLQEYLENYVTMVREVADAARKAGVEVNQ